MFVTEETSRRLHAPNAQSNPTSPFLRVAVFARRGHLRAAPPRIKRVVSPLYMRILTHSVLGRFASRLALGEARFARENRQEQKANIGAMRRG